MNPRGTASLTSSVVVNVCAQHDEMNSPCIKRVVETAVGARFLGWNSESCQVRCESDPINLRLDFMIAFSHHHGNP